MSFSINHSFKVEAKKSTLWHIITDTEQYKDWNPFVTDCHTSFEVGSPIFLKVQLLPLASISQRETILLFQEGERFDYGIQLPLGALTSQRSHQLTQLNNGDVWYRSTFELSGWLSPLVKLLLFKALVNGFESMTHALIRRAEITDNASQLTRRAS